MKLLNYKQEELSGKHVYDLLHPDDLNYYASGHKECKYTLALPISF
jgi:PAS fold